MHTETQNSFPHTHLHTYRQRQDTHTQTNTDSHTTKEMLSCRGLIGKLPLYLRSLAFGYVADTSHHQDEHCFYFIFKKTIFLKYVFPEAIITLRENLKLYILNRLEEAPRLTLCNKTTVYPSFGMNPSLHFSLPNH